MDTIETHQQATHLDPSDTFVRRHLGPRQAEIPQMLQTLGCNSLEELIDQTIPASIRMTKPLALGPARSEHELLGELRTLAKKNHLLRSYIGMGYYGTITPPVIQRNVLESPGWYTQYTPYQAEIAQGRLEALLNFQTMVADLTGMPLANASLLDEATACAEAMAMCSAVAGGRRRERNVFFVSDHCHPQNIAVVQSRAKSMGVQCVVGSLADLDLSLKNICGALLSYPTTDGRIEDYGAIIEDLHEHGALAVVVTDLLALTLLTPPSEFKADIVVGSTQRFGCPMGFGGPHAGFLATHEAHARKIPGRIIGVSKDRHERSGYRLTLQTREQHIRRDKATSNICTAQVLPAILASMYAVYHGPQGLIRIAQRVRSLTCILRQGLIELGCQIDAAPRFDTLRVAVPGVDATQILAAAVSRQMNLREFSDGSVGISLDETTSKMDVTDLLSVFSGVMSSSVAPRSVDDLAREVDSSFPPLFARSQEFMKHPVFNSHHSETEMLRYMARLQSRDLSLTMSMIPLGSCTMKLNGTTEMIPITWPEFAHLHPFVPAEQSSGYAELFQRLEKDLAEITGFAGISLQPNAGSQGEYAGLLVIHAYHESLGEGDRDICLIPVSAHGTNPASAIIAGFRVVTVKCDENGNVDVQDLAKKADKHQKELGALMVTYPSTHGVFEERIQEICKIVHDAGGQVYMDGANMNAQVGLCRPADMGADVCHLNLHKTFCIPHGGGGPGMGPIGVAPQLLPFLPGHPVVPPAGAGEQSVGAIAAAPYGSPSILPISFLYIELMGAEGLKRATQIAILNANYMAKRLEEHYDILYRGKNGRVAHEFIIDLRPFDKAGVKIDDVAKRLIDYGYHAPTMSFPVPGTLMIEPTESESLQELDRYCEALISIRKEIQQVVSGKWSPEDNPLHNAPHTMQMVCGSEWTHPYSREEAAFPATHLQVFKFWPVVSRIDNYYGDRNLFCTCPMPSK